MSEEIRSAILRVLPFIIVLIAITVLIRNKKTTTQAFYLNKPVSKLTYFIWVGAFLVYSILTDFILYKTGNLEIAKWDHKLLPSIILITGAVILGPLVEELLFRARIFDLMIRWFKNLHLANFVQACIFVLLHHFTYLNTKSSYIDIVQSLGDAILFGYARIYTRSIYTSTTMHMTGNLIATIERFIF
ncbi:membrane protease YdiL (CAAX protease family) [Pedobacter cryoconitis]|uniref:CPBP family intramembrane glutamic endopeptidase n=1 Tax=Pedobacter cryoconitis TaxID=188932 RepID=UPI001610DE12|nr:CPBP family intramembrane glutamic endopeptidase [Pedobacter cryoconitis]MBB6272466.1 membrane protease YdiL (CAAX protease family) [Pedobacter cryoconitis]